MYTDTLYVQCLSVTSFMKRHDLKYGYAWHVMADGPEPHIYRTTIYSALKGQALLVMDLLSPFKALKLQKLKTCALHCTHAWIKAHLISTAIGLIMLHVYVHLSSNLPHLIYH